MRSLVGWQTYNVIIVMVFVIIITVIRSSQTFLPCWTGTDIMVKLVSRDKNVFKPNCYGIARDKAKRQSMI